MTPETYYTIRRIQSPCKSESSVLFDLTYRRVWRTELGDQGQWCDLLVEQKEVETDQFPPVRLDEKLETQFEGYTCRKSRVGGSRKSTLPLISGRYDCGGSRRVRFMSSAPIGAIGTKPCPST